MKARAFFDAWTRARSFDIYDTFVVHRRYQLSRVHHPRPFNKTQRGKARRAERRFRMEQREADYDATASPFVPTEPLHHRETRYGIP